MLAPHIRLTVLLGILAGAVAHGAQAESKSVSVSDPRPVAKALELLEQVYGVPVNYEDPPYAHDGDIIDVTAQVSRDPDSTHRVIGPRGGTVSFKYNLLTTRGVQQPGFGVARYAVAPQIELRNAIADLLRNYAVIRGSDEFVLLRTGRLSVVPARMRDSRAHITRIDPILNSAVSLSPRERTGIELISELCDQLSSTTGTKVVVGMMPMGLFATRTTNIGTSNEPARSILSRFFDEVGTGLSWQLFYDPGLQMYALNIHSVRPKS